MLSCSFVEKHLVSKKSCSTIFQSWIDYLTAPFSDRKFKFPQKSLHILIWVSRKMHNYWAILPQRPTGKDENAFSLLLALDSQFTVTECCFFVSKVLAALQHHCLFGCNYKVIKAIWNSLCLFYNLFLVYEIVNTRNKQEKWEISLLDHWWDDFGHVYTLYISHTSAKNENSFIICWPCIIVFLL